MSGSDAAALSAEPEVPSGVEISTGDCLTVMLGMAENSVDSIVTDPPYGIGFMGKAWDGQDIINRLGIAKRSGIDSAVETYDLSPKAMRAFQEFSSEWGRAALRIMKPGAHCVAFASPRTVHRLVCGLEEAGFEIRDTLMWVFGSGYPKSKNLCTCKPSIPTEIVDSNGWRLCGHCGNQYEIGTALKPAWEPIVLARKPLISTVAANVSTYGTGAINIDRCRVEASDDRAPNTGSGAIPCRHQDGVPRAPGIVTQPHSLGRWPANLVHDGGEEVLAAFPHASGAVAPVRGTETSKKTDNTFGAFAGRSASDQRDGGGSAARFFYCAKASRTERNDGCEGMTAKPLNWSSGTQSPGTFQAEGTRRESENDHPTVKPTDLMRWLCRLVTPPGGHVVDPFMGSGSTGRAAVLEGFKFTGIELEDPYTEIARARIAACTKMVYEESQKPTQQSLFGPDA